MSIELWLQYDSKNPEEYKDCNQDLCKFLEEHLEEIIPKIKKPFSFKLVDVSCPEDIEEASSRGITKLPMLIYKQERLVGPAEIKNYIMSLITKRERRRANPEDDGIDAPVIIKDDEQEVQNMLWDGIVENDDEEDDKDGNSQVIAAKAEEFNRRREKYVASQPKRRTPGRGRSQPADGRRALPRARPDGYRPSGESRSKKPPPPSQSSKTKSQKPKKTRQPQEDSDNEPEEKPRRRRGADIDISPAEVSRGLPASDSREKEDDQMMAQFWDNQSATVY